MIDGFDNNALEEKREKTSNRKTRISTILLILIFLFLLSILILTIIILINLKSETITDKEEKSDKSDKSPIIGITGMRIPDGNETLYTADQTQIHYIEAIEKAGGIPISLPVLQNLNSEVIRRQVEVIDGLLIQGGLDVSPSLYNEEPKEELGLTDLQTDNFLIEVIKQARERKIPILGICRGIHILNVAFGGTLHQDLKYAGLPSDKHKQPDDTMCDYKHTIKVENNAYLKKMFPNNDTLYVNSFHHQALNKLGKDVIVEATSEDGIIEAIHLDDKSQWVFGFQPHPEQQLRCKNDFLPIFSEFIKQARQKMDGQNK